MDKNYQNAIALFEEFASKFGLIIKKFEVGDYYYPDFGDTTHFAVKPRADISWDGPSAWHVEETGEMAIIIHADDEGDPDINNDPLFDLMNRVSQEELRQIINTGIGPGGRRMIDCINSWSGGQVEETK